MKSLIVLSVLALAGLVHGASVTIFDKEYVIDTYNTVENVCTHTRGKNKQISRLSTVEEISTFLWNIDWSEHPLYQCQTVYGEAVRQFEELIKVSEDNVCSKEKIDAVRNYHHNYILKGKQGRKAPKMLATFFYHYANAITEVCASDAVNFIKSFKTPKAESPEVEKTFAEISSMTGVPTSARLQYQDIFLIWSIVDMLPFRDENFIKKYLFEGEKRAVMATKNAEGFLKMQEMCRTQVKPIYSVSFLSAIRLIEMGYYPTETNMLEELNNNDVARKFYELTRVCEAILPVRVIEQPARADNEIVMLTHDEVESLGLDESELVGEVEGPVCKTCSYLPDHIKTVTDDQAIPVANTIKNNIQKRKGAIFRLIKIFLSNIKKEVAENMKKAFSRDTPENVDDVDMSQLEMFDVSHDDESGQVRTRRGLKQVLAHIGEGFLRIAIVTILALWLVVKYLIFRPIFIVLAIFDLFFEFVPDSLADFLWTGGANLLEKKKKLSE